MFEIQLQPEDISAAPLATRAPATPRRTRKNYPAKLKAQVALEAIKGQKTLKELSDEFGVHYTTLESWKLTLQSGALTLFENHMLKFKKTRRERQLEQQLRKTQMQLSWLKNYHRPQ